VRNIREVTSSPGSLESERGNPLAAIRYLEDILKQRGGGSALLSGGTQKYSWIKSGEEGGKKSGISIKVKHRLRRELLREKSRKQTITPQGKRTAFFSRETQVKVPGRSIEKNGGE